MGIVVGMVLFALDCVIFVLGQDWLGVGFHVVALFFMFRGFQACRNLRAREPAGNCTSRPRLQDRAAARVRCYCATMPHQIDFPLVSPDCHEINFQQLLALHGGLSRQSGR